MATRGFFAGSTLARSRAPAPTIPHCGACGLFKTCQSPKMGWTGNGRRKILIIGEAPGETEDIRGEQFVGKSGLLLRRVLRGLGIDLDADCWKTNALICRPPNNATPDARQIDYCRPNLNRTLEELKPEVIIPLGQPAVAALLGAVWRGADGIGPMGRWAGWRVPWQRHNAWVCPTWHPAFILRGEDQRDEDVAKLLWNRHLAAAVALAGRPWEAVPDYKREVECIHDPAQAAKVVDEMVRRGGPCAWDYETNALKPEGTEAKIVSCSICWRGRRTIAYPWHGPAVAATQRFIRSPLPKIASNQKFEERWTLAAFGHGVRAWYHDTMLSAHHLDNRKWITSIKFQAFVLLGAEAYDDHIAQFLKTEGDEEINEIIRQVDVKDLLLYNAMDSLLEFKVAAIQRGGL